VLSAAGFFVALWLCPIHVFANLALYLAAINLAALAVFGRYELLIVAAQTERQHADAVHLCILTGAGTVATVFLIAIFFQHLATTYVTVCFAGGLFARAWLRLGLTLATRDGRYNHAVKALAPHAVCQPFILISLIYYGHNPFLAFILSDFLGQLIAAACVSISERHSLQLTLRARIRPRIISRLALLNLRLPTLNLLAVTSAFLFATMPLFFLSGLSNVTLAGMLALLFRILDVPTILTSASLTSILVKEVAENSRNDIAWPLRSTFLLPATIAIIVFGLISLGSLTLAHLELAPSWHMALTILPVVALFQAGIAAASPLIDMATLTGRQKGLFGLNFISVGLATLALMLWRDEPIFATLIAGVIGMARVGVMSVWLVRSNADASST
jgi:hypothetical protein